MTFALRRARAGREVSGGAGAWFESLEPRRLLAAVYPTADEQLMLELLNRARANPVAEAQRFKIDLNEGLAAETISAAPKQPLAFNPFLIDAARKHSRDMLARDYFAHESPSGKMPDQRVRAAGYMPDGGGENLAWWGTTGDLGSPTATVRKLHRDLFVDAGIDGRGHRLDILKPSFKEVGVGVISGLFTTGGRDYNALMITQDFAFVTSNTFLTGVAYADRRVADKFYTPGEGLAGLTITAKRLSDKAVFSTTTFRSGGYSLQLEPGTYSVSASGGQLLKPMVFKNVTIGQENVKLDVIPAPGTPLNTPPTAKLRASSVVRPAKGYVFKVTYTDTPGLKASTLSTGDVQVVNAGGFRQVAKLIARTSSADATTITATYKILPPGGAWNAPDNGTYSVWLRASEVSDVRGLFAPGRKLGLFSVSI